MESNINDETRAQIWKLHLGIKDTKPNLKEFFGLEEQSEIREDCVKLVEALGNPEDDRLAITSDLETVLTTYAETYGYKYFTDNGWLEVIEPLLTLKIGRDDLYNFFEIIHKKYIPNIFTYPKNSEESHSINDQPFHLLRLLLFYHDPELCSFLDTKKINPDSYALSWFRSLFAAHVNIKALLTLWDAYLQASNPFLIFFLSLVMLVNAKEQIMSMKDQSKEAIIKTLNSVPSALEIDDIPDLFYLVETHYVSQTPRCISELHKLIFNYDSGIEFSMELTDIAQALCLPIPVSHLLPSSNNSGVRFFIVDCRPAEQYNNGHLSTAFHLDCSLMLQEPSAFNTAVQALLAAQKQAILAGSLAGGKHLCFMGSGRDEEDRYVHMVVASFLQKHHLYVSLAFGGYAALHHFVLRNNCLDKYFTDHNKKLCLSCRNPQSFIGNSPMGSRSLSSSNSSLLGAIDGENASNTSIFDRMASVMKNRAVGVKEKLVDYIINPSAGDERHVSATDRLGRRYTGGSNIFSLFDVDNGDGLVSNEPEDFEFDVEEWCKANNALSCFKCEEITDEIKRYPSYLILTETHLYIVRAIPQNKGFGKIVAKRPLEMIVQITSRRRLPNLITIKYGQANDESNSEPTIMALDKLNIPEPYPVTRLLKQQVIKVLNGEVENHSATGQENKSSDQ
ncbi:TBC1 domain family member 23 [Tetranychus urticae]|uniref:TBC1 domain family member 23 n=1 Tax=Tetranychus urticae TaxID=32264 RepID=T1KWX3_TETUR|nr:TBC1 domain family member 23 [Tetranychus urticae]